MNNDLRTAYDATVALTSLAVADDALETASVIESPALREVADRLAAIASVNADWFRAVAPAA